MKILLVLPAEAMSTRDVGEGYKKALERRSDINLKVYDLASRAVYHKEALKRLLDKDKPYSWQNISELASADIVYEAFVFEPDWILIISGLFFHPNALIALNRAGFKTAWIFTECPYDDDKQIFLAKFLRVCFVDDVASLEKFRKVNVNTCYLPKACDPERHKKVEVSDEFKSDVIFIGTGYEDRVKLLEKVNWDGINLKILGTWKLRRNSPLRKYTLSKIITNDASVKFYNGAKIGLNLHRAHPYAYSANPRTFELSACGTFQICDKRQEVINLFGDSIEYFENSNDLEQKIRHYLDNEGERFAKAEKARQIALRQTFDARVNILLKNLSEREESIWRHYTVKME